MIWLALGSTVITIVIAVILLQKKSGEISKLSEELVLIQQERDGKSTALKELEHSFEEKMDKVVQSSIQKIAHAEQSKEEAVQAASDNYEMAAEAHALLKEKDAIIEGLENR